MFSSNSLLFVHYRTEVGRQAEEIVAQGKLLPDEVMLKVVTSQLDRLRNKVPYIEPTWSLHTQPQLTFFPGRSIGSLMAFPAHWARVNY